MLYAALLLPEDRTFLSDLTALVAATVIQSKCGRQNNGPLKCVHILTPETWENAILHRKITLQIGLSYGFKNRETIFIP